MRRIILPIGVCVAMLLAAMGQAKAAVISSGSLYVNIRNDNAAIDTVMFGGRDYYNPGSSVSDWGLQVGTNTLTFRRATTSGGFVGSTSVVQSGGIITGSGTYTIGANINWTREYSLVSGFNVLRTVTSLTNVGISSATIRLFDTADPDQGPGTSTYNDLFSLAGIAVGQSSASYGTVVFGPTSSDSSFGANATNFGLGITNGSQLNNLFTAAAYDPNNAYQDIGWAVGYEFIIAPGATVSVTLDQAFGLTAQEAQDAFLQSQTVVPEPMSLAIWSGFGAIGLAFGAVRRRRSNAAA